MLLAANNKPPSFSHPLVQRCLLLCREGVVPACSFLSTFPATTQNIHIQNLKRDQGSITRHMNLALISPDAAVVATMNTVKPMSYE